MSALPNFNEAGDLPPKVHQATLTDVIERFGKGSIRRRLVAQRLRRIYELATHTGHLARFIVFGSFVTAHPEPNDIDVFLLMDDTFDVGDVRGEGAILFNHVPAGMFQIRRGIG